MAVFKEIQDEGPKVKVDMVKFSMIVQSRIITDILVGPGYATKPVPYEESDGSTGSRILAEYLDLITEDMMLRVQKNPLIMILGAKIMEYEITKEDTRFFKNSKHLRGFIQQAINDRLKIMADQNEGTPPQDMIGILLQDENYKDCHSDIIDDVLVMFIAGSKTIQGTTTNFITHCIEDPSLSERFHAEIDPVLEPMKNNITD